MCPSPIRLRMNSVGGNLPALYLRLVVERCAEHVTGTALETDDDWQTLLRPFFDGNIDVDANGRVHLGHPHYDVSKWISSFLPTISCRPRSTTVQGICPLSPCMSYSTISGKAA